MKAKMKSFKLKTVQQFLIQIIMKKNLTLINRKIPEM